MVTYPHGLLRSILVQRTESWGIKDLNLEGDGLGVWKRVMKYNEYKEIQRNVTDGL